MSTKKVPIVAIVGRANVGKSSLFNAMLGRREAIVANEAGTTRDSIYGKASYEEHDFWLVDTAGMKNPEDDFEFTIQEQIVQAADSADLILVVIEAQSIISEEDRRVAKLALKTKKPVILIVNKQDQNIEARYEDFLKLGIKQMIFTSVPQRKGIIEMLDKIIKDLPVVQIREASDRIRVALLGRPNVGKSSLFNALAKKQQAVVSDRAGTTRDVNKLMIKYNQREIELMDTAGIRRSGKIERGVEHFSVIRTLAAIEESDVCFLLVDVNDLRVQLDQKIAGLIKEAGKGLIMVVSKWDTFDKDAYSHDQLLGRIRADFDFVPWATVIFTSTVDGQNVSKLFDLVLEVMERRQIKIATNVLNRWLIEAVDKHPPAGLKNRHPRLNYITQTDDSVPSFKVFGSHTKFLHWSYKRFLERELREKYDLAGTPVKFWFIEKH